MHIAHRNEGIAVSDSLDTQLDRTEGTISHAPNNLVGTNR